jgi:hypothetical protein
LTQVARQRIASVEYDAIERTCDRLVGGALNLFQFSQPGTRVVLAEQRALHVAAMGAQRQHALEDCLVRGGEAAGLQAVAIAADGRGHLHGRADQGTDGQCRQEHQQKRAYRFFEHRQRAPFLRADTAAHLRTVR